MIFEETILKGSFLVSHDKYEDERGWFFRSFCKKEFSAIGHTEEWVQMNHSYTQKKGTIRGMHFQQPPFEEAKLVRCISGCVFDVIIDLRIESATYLKYTSVELSATNRKSLYIPKGFAHGFQTMEDYTELLYCHTQYYTPDFESGLRYDDPAININWPLNVTSISVRDLKHPKFNTH